MKSMLFANHRIHVRIQLKILSNDNHVRDVYIYICIKKAILLTEISIQTDKWMILKSDENDRMNAFYFWSTRIKRFVKVDFHLSDSMIRFDF